MLAGHNSWSMAISTASCYRQQSRQMVRHSGQLFVGRTHHSTPSALTCSLLWPRHPPSSHHLPHWQNSQSVSQSIHQSLIHQSTSQPANQPIIQLLTHSLTQSADACRLFVLCEPSTQRSTVSSQLVVLHDRFHSVHTPGPISSNDPAPRHATP